MGEAIGEEANQMMQQLLEGDALFEATQNLLFQASLEAQDVQILQDHTIYTFRELKQRIAENGYESIVGLSRAKVEAICYESDRVVALRKAESNLTQTMACIGRRAQLSDFLKCKKRIETLQASIAIGARRQAQITHWNLELEACLTRLSNMLENNF